MKALAFVLLLVAASCQVKESNDWVDSLRCVVDSALPLKAEVFKLLDAIVAKDTELIVTYVLSLSGHASDIYLKCFKEALELAINWKAFGKCLLEKAKEQGKLLPIIQELIELAKAKEWLKLAIKALPLLFKGIKIVVECVKESK